MSPRQVISTKRRQRDDSTKTGEVGVQGRNQILEAAIASILEVGFYRSSTNEIARRAKVSWGALQYHFGTRGALWLAVVKELDRRFVEDLERTEITAQSSEERVRELFSVLERHYDSSTFLVRLQILLNLQHDPDISEDVRGELADNAASAYAPIAKLMRQVLGARAPIADWEALFHAMRGFAVSRQFSRAISVEGSGRPTEEGLNLFLRGLVTGQPALRSWKNPL